VTFLTSSRVTAITLSESAAAPAVEAVEITGPGGDVLRLGQCDVVLACGPWTPSVLRQLFPRSGAAVDVRPRVDSGHWAVFRIPRPVTADEVGLVVSARPGGEAGRLELAVRRDGTLWVSGLDDVETPVPSDPCARIEAPADVVQTYRDHVASATDFGGKELLELVESGRCHRPATDRQVPIVARVDGRRLLGLHGVGKGDGSSDADCGRRLPFPTRGGGVFIGAGHGSRGMMLSLGTGLLLSKMVRGEALDFDVSSLGLDG
jgi:glycine/D-amino acid oxidase-like deaminating enzyme